jgi:septum formation protein
VPFEVVVPETEELTAGDPVAVAVENARRKALAVRAAQVRSSQNDANLGSSAGGPVLGVDTVVALDARIYGKPADEGEARATLATLGGRTHAVVSGIAVADDGGVRTASATTAVTFRPLDRSLLDWYLATGEWRERAGGYAIQGRGAALVAGIEGDYLNVVGLPTSLLVRLLAERFPGTYGFG